MRPQRIPIMKEVEPSEAKVGDLLWGWWDGVCNSWHVKEKALEITSSTEWDSVPGAFDIHAEKFAYTFDNRSRLLVEVRGE